MNAVSKIVAGAAIFALVALLSMPLVMAAGGDGTGPAPGTRGQMMNQNGNAGGPCPQAGNVGGPCPQVGNVGTPCPQAGNVNAPCPQAGRGHGHGPCCKGNCAGAGQGGFVDKDGDGICDHHANNGKGGDVAK